MKEPGAPVDPKAVVPDYETDLSAVGTNRQVRPDLMADEVEWAEIHPEIAKEIAP